MKTFYTVLCDRAGYPVRYIHPDTWRVSRFTGPFGDPGEASQEFKARVGGEQSCYLDEQAFQGKARAIARLRRERKREDEHE